MALEEIASTITYPKITLEITGAVEKLTSLQAIHLFRIFQELLTNSLKHADASGIVMSIHHAPERCVCQYVDDGVGFDLNKPLGGMGRSNIESRVQVLKGESAWFSASGKGLKFDLVFAP